MSSNDHEMLKAPDGTPMFKGPDGLHELDNPMPRWMTTVFVGTVLWGVGYLVLMPGMGLNLLGWGQYSQYEAEVAEAKARFPAASGDAATLAAAALKDPEAIARGKATFGASCAACHGQEGQGAIGPSLKDATWLYGARPAEIAHTIAEGTAKGMPPFKTALGATQLAEVAAFVHALGAGK
jgi:cytochrome c oxidase cbb3-type subunit III